MRMQHCCNYYCTAEVHAHVVCTLAGTSPDEVMRLASATELLYDVMYLRCRPAPEADTMQILRACRQGGVYVHSIGEIDTPPDEEAMGPQEGWLLFFRDAAPAAVSS